MAKDQTSERLNLTFSERAEQSANVLARKLYALMSQKETNLCLALDETDPERFLAMADVIGPEIALLKTHVDTLEGFTGKVPVDLANIAREHNFLIFEDRKFADIGQIVKNQYTKGIFHIIEWADIVNAHALPGPGVIEGIREEVVDYDLLDKRGLLLLAQMSSRGNLIDEAYTRQVVAMAETHDDFVIGFIGAGLKDLPTLAGLAPTRFLILTPGVKLQDKKDRLGQQYTSPEAVVAAGADVIIVGRGIYQDDKPLAKAKEYRKAAWQAYQARVRQPKVTRDTPDRSKRPARRKEGRKEQEGQNPSHK